MTRTQSTALIVGAIALVGAALFAQQMPPKELTPSERAEISINCLKSAKRMMED